MDPAKCWLVILICASAAAQQRFDSVTIEAERHIFDAARNVVEASGGVTVTGGGITLVAEKVTYNVDTGIASAEGEVVITETGRTFSGSASTYNFKTGHGSVQNVSAEDETLGLRLYLKGGEIEIKPAAWVLRDARISTTLEEDPNYLVTAKEVELIPGDRWYARDVNLYVFGHRLIGTSEYSRSLVHPEDFVLDLLPDIAYTAEESLFIEYDRATRLGGDLWVGFDARLSPRTGLSGRATAEFRPSRGHAYATWAYREDPRDPFLPALRVSRAPEIGVTYPLVAPRKHLDIAAHASWGQYQERPSGTSTWRRLYQVSGGHSDLKLGSKTAWRYEFGYSHAEYGTGSTYETLHGGVSLRHRFGDDLKMSLGYRRHSIKGSTPFLWDDVDIPHELRTGIQFPLLGRFGARFVGRYDLDQRRYRDKEYSLLYRDTDLIYSATWLERRQQLLLELKLPLVDEWF